MRAPGAEDSVGSADAVRFPGDGGRGDNGDRAHAGARSRHAYRAPSPEHLGVDDYMVEPETRWEVVDGQRVYASPAAAPHGDNHFNLDYVLRAHLVSGYIGSTDLLTRWDENNNYATDTSVRRQGIDPATGSRHLEELAFEVANTQRRKDLAARARMLLERGVRRVFAIFVTAGDVKEWSAQEGAFIPLALDSYIEDECLARPLMVRAVLDAAAADNEVARALLARRNPVIEEVRQKDREQSFKDGRKKGFDDGRKQGFDDGRKQGFDDGRKQGFDDAVRQERLSTIQALCELHQILLSPARRQLLDTAGVDALGHILQALLGTHRWPEE